MSTVAASIQPGRTYQPKWNTRDTHKNPQMYLLVDSEIIAPLDCEDGLSKTPGVFGYLV
jgi:hypothetical protein